MEARSFFPFIGAGEASYFEWADMVVAFERVPTEAEKAAIAERVPVPLRTDVTWKGRVLEVGSEQGVGRQISAAYGKQNKPPTKLTTQSRFTSAPPSAYARFNADIEEWLAFAHTCVPVLVAFRGEDSEAGGTALSDWHHTSVSALPKVLAELAADRTEGTAALGLLLVDAARRANVDVEVGVGETLERRADDETKARRSQGPDWGALAAAATEKLGEPAPLPVEERSEVDMEPALARLASVLPLTAKRLQRMSKKGLAVRPGASAEALRATEKALGVSLSPEHRALLETFDGGQIGEITFLGTAEGGAVRDAELATFTRAWNGPRGRSVILAHTRRNDVVALPAGESGPTRLFDGQPGWGGGGITRECKKLDSALDAVLKAGRVFNNKARPQ